MNKTADEIELKKCFCLPQIFHVSLTSQFNIYTNQNTDQYTKRKSINGCDTKEDLCTILLKMYSASILFASDKDGV